MTSPVGPDEMVTEAYQLEDEASMLEFYRKWAEDYDRQMLQGLGYLSPTKIAELLTSHLENKESAILDIGCGTGLTSVYLAEQGFNRLDGIDLSEDMIRVAAQRGIYRELLVGDLNQPLDRDSAMYDAVISSGTFTHGHVGPEPLDEIFRILKPGGLLACTIHKELWDQEGFSAKLTQLVESQIAEQMQLYDDQYFEDGPREGWFCLYRRSGS
ncbi:MAG: class I SAM-dependent methyltransferase [Pseudomonadota bacterium]